MATLLRSPALVLLRYTRILFDERPVRTLRIKTSVAGDFNFKDDANTVNRDITDRTLIP